MGLLSSLFRYKESEGRSPLEDFLTECLRYLLQQLEDAHLSGEAASRLLRIEGLMGATLIWQTQYAVPVSYGSDVGKKRPDLVAIGELTGKAVFLIVENKISAGYTEALDALTGELQNQLVLYRGFLRRRPDEIKHIRLLTHQTPKPPEWSEEETQHWRKLAASLDQWTREDLKFKAPFAHLFATELLEFLKEQGMTKITISLEEIAANAAAVRLRDHCRALGGVASQMNAHPAWKRFVEGNLRPTNGFGGLGADRFFGLILTPDGKRLDDVSAAVSVGVLKEAVRSPYYQIELGIEHVPEFHAFMGLWGKRERFVSDEVMSTIEALRKVLGDDWLKTVRDFDHRGDKCQVIYLAFRQPFTKVFGSVDDWVEEARAFFKSRLDNLNGLEDGQVKFIRSWQS